jgi:23S rRNA (uridine2552-2'-O)-methyltransferase
VSRYVPRDPAYLRAHAGGYRSRAVFKLRALLREMPAVRRGAAVVELGCWPGGWLQVLAETVGPEGAVVGVDLVPVEPLAAPVETLALDFTAEDAAERILAVLGRRADAVLCDAAPKLSGVRDVDRAALLELHQAALRVAAWVLRPGGVLLVKAFPGPEAAAFRAELARALPPVRELHPEGTRRTSKEFYLSAGGSPRGGRGRPRPRPRTRAGTRA